MCVQESKMYEEVGSLDEFTSIVQGSLEEYNNTHKNRMNLVIFRYAHTHTLSHALTASRNTGMCWSTCLASAV